MLRNIFLSFIPIFVAVDAIGVLPIFVGLTEDVDPEKRNKMIIQSMITGLCVAIGFIFAGRALFKFLNITIGDFMIAGGTVLFCISIIDIINPGKERRHPNMELGVVPLGTPLIVGPAVLTVSLISLESFGISVTLISVITNILIAGLILSLSNILIKSLGVAGSRAVSKVTSLFLAAIAVMLVRKGIIHLLNMQ